jgi:hypothetical protein
MTVPNHPLRRARIPGPDLRHFGHDFIRASYRLPGGNRSVVPAYWTHGAAGRPWRRQETDIPVASSSTSPRARPSSGAGTAACHGSTRSVRVRRLHCGHGPPNYRGTACEYQTCGNRPVLARAARWRASILALGRAPHNGPATALFQIYLRGHNHGPLSALRPCRERLNVLAQRVRDVPALPCLGFARRILTDVLKFSYCMSLPRDAA